MNPQEMKVAGQKIECSVRVIERYLKCPLRYEIDKDIKKDFYSFIPEILDQTFAHSSLRISTGDIPTIDSLETQFRKRTSGFEVPEEYLEQMIKGKVRKHLENFHKLAEKILEKNTVIVPFQYVDYTAHGVTLKIPIFFTIRPKGGSLRSTTYLTLAYSRSASTTLALSYSRLWVSAVNLTLQAQGISAVDASYADISTGKVYKGQMGRNGMAKTMIDNICLSLNSALLQPRFGYHCQNCPYQVQCSVALDP